MKEPRRLSQSTELPQSIRDAFGALGQRAPSEETVARVQRALQALPAVTPIPRVWHLSTLLSVATLVTIAVTSVVFLRQRGEGEGEGESVRSHPVATVTEPAAPAAARAEPPLQVHPVVEPVVQVPRVAQPDRVRAARGPVAHPRREDAPVRTKAWAQAPVRTQVTIDTAAPSSRDLGTDSAPTEPNAQPQPEAQRVQKRAVEEPQDEAGLLYRAKHLAIRDPEAALQLLESHVHYFPNGAFLEEREMLAIRLHQRLGHDDTAKHLVEQFRARFPDSVYRNAVVP